MRDSEWLEKHAVSAAHANDAGRGRRESHGDREFEHDVRVRERKRAEARRVRDASVPYSAPARV